MLGVQSLSHTHTYIVMITGASTSQKLKTVYCISYEHGASLKKLKLLPMMSIKTA